MDIFICGEYLSAACYCGTLKAIMLINSKQNLGLLQRSVIILHDDTRVLPLSNFKFLCLLKSKSPESVCKKTLTWSKLSPLYCRHLTPISFTPLYRPWYKVGRIVGIPVIQRRGRYQPTSYLIWDSILYVLFSYFSENCLKICTPFKNWRWYENSELTFMDVEWKTYLMSVVILFHLLCAQHVSDINISIFRSLWLCWWITISVVLFSVRCVLELLVRLVLGGVRFAGFSLQNTQRTENKKTDVVIHQHSRKLLKMDILMSETCWAHNKWNKTASDIKLEPHQKLQHTTNWEQDDGCGNSSTQSQAPEDGCINVRNMLST